MIRYVMYLRRVHCTNTLLYLMSLSGSGQTSDWDVMCIQIIINIKDLIHVVVNYKLYYFNTFNTWSNLNQALYIYNNVYIQLFLIYSAFSSFPIKTLFFCWIRYHKWFQLRDHIGLFLFDFSLFKYINNSKRVKWGQNINNFIINILSNPWNVLFWWYIIYV